MRQAKQIGLASAPTDSQALTKKYLSPRFSGYTDINAMGAVLTMRDVLTRFNIKYDDGLATQWQPVNCGVCSHDKAQVMLHGRYGHIGAFSCRKCGTKGGATKVMAAFLNVPMGMVRGFL